MHRLAAYAPLVAVLLLWAGDADAQAAAQIGGKPPAAVKTKLCSISNVFSQLTKIKTNSECLKGCAKVNGKCPTDWYPGKAVSCLRQRFFPCLLYTSPSPRD